MLTALVQRLRSPQHRRATVAVTAALALVVLLAHSEGEGGEHMAADMSEGVAMCLAVLAGAVGTAAGLFATGIGGARRVTPRVIHAVGSWDTPVPRFEPVARVGPPELQVFRL